MIGALVSIDTLELLPALAPAVGAVLVLVVDALLPRAARVARVLGLVALVAGLVGAIRPLTTGTRIAQSLCLPAPQARCLYDTGSAGLLLQVGALLAGVVVLVLLWDHDAGEAATQRGGVGVTTALVLTTVAGATTVAAAVDLGTWLVALELATLPAVALVALRGTDRAAHGAVSLLMTAVLSAALTVVGAALWVVATHDLTFSPVSASAAWGDATTRPALVLGVVVMLAGLGFKLSAVPFHQWTPQAYAGSSVPVAALLATVSKIAAVAGIIAVLRAVGGLLGPGGHAPQLALVVAILAVATMTLGNVVALRQDDVVRLLAWSTIAQAGWVLLPLASLRDVGLRSAATYVVAYAIASLVAFAVVPFVGTRLAAYGGLLRRHPLLGGALVLGLVSLAGLPPGILGLVAKVVALRPVMDAGLWPLALVAVANAVLGIAVYLRWVAVLFGDPSPDADPFAGGWGARAGLALATTLLIVTSAVPHVVLGLLA
ncbi:MAG: proton-conducting transporter membrane subunit [Nostocoides sp.]